MELFRKIISKWLWLSISASTLPGSTSEQLIPECPNLKAETKAIRKRILTNEFNAAGSYKNYRQRLGSRFSHNMNRLKAKNHYIDFGSSPYAISGFLRHLEEQGKKVPLITVVNAALTSAGEYYFKKFKKTLPGFRSEVGFVETFKPGRLRLANVASDVIGPGSYVVKFDQYLTVIGNALKPGGRFFAYIRLPEFIDSRGRIIPPKDFFTQHTRGFKVAYIQGPSRVKLHDALLIRTKRKKAQSRNLRLIEAKDGYPGYRKYQLADGWTNY